eukprot:TRINITY_DN29692_c0_g1_i10.p1 TRINITY_DN29692_c0_g1~~TRINITY_DN29692_c0_g1_i10.p1  ORF type:complete len:188 (+),score=16.91 TRINITY_DN29692_c0_g1_i10:302-865(+)
MLQRYLTDCIQLALGNWDETEILNEVKNSNQLMQSVVQCSMDFTSTFSELFPFARSSEASVCQELPKFQKAPVEQLNLLNISGNLDDTLGNYNKFEDHSNYEEEAVQNQVVYNGNISRRMNKQMSMQSRIVNQNLGGKQWQLKRCLSDPRAIKIGTARYSIGNKKDSNQKDDGPPVRNLIAFFEKNN